MVCHLACAGRVTRPRLDWVRSIESQRKIFQRIIACLSFSRSSMVEIAHSANGGADAYRGGSTDTLCPGRTSWQIKKDANVCQHLRSSDIG